MAVLQTPFNYCFRMGLASPNIKSGLDQYSDCDYRGSLRSTIIFCSVATIPLSGPYSCIFASFSFDAVGQRL